MAIDWRSVLRHDPPMSFSVMLALVLGGCSAPVPLTGNTDSAERAVAMNNSSSQGPAEAGTAQGGGVTGLPFSHGKAFASLDEYLEHLERHAAPIDQPWWREVRPGVYEHVKRMPGATPEIATRDELMRRFGFSR